MYFLHVQIKSDPRTVHIEKNVLRTDLSDYTKLTMKAIKVWLEMAALFYCGTQ